MADLYISGKQGSVRTVNSSGFSFSFDTWELSSNAKLPDITNFTSGGYQALLSGIIDGTVTVSGPYNSGNMAFTAGLTYVWVLCFTDAIYLTCTAIIQTLKADDKVADAPRINIVAKSTGSFSAGIV